MGFSPDGTHIVSGGSDGAVRVWQVDGKPAAEPFEGYYSRISSVGFSPDGTRIVSGGGDGTVRVWRLDGQPAAEPFEGYNGGIASVGVSPDSTRIASGDSDGTLRIWQLDGQPNTKLFKGHAGWVSSVGFSPDGTRIVSGGDDGTLRLWQLDGMPVLEPFKGHDGGVFSVAFSPDGTRIVSGGRDRTVRLWQLDGNPAAGSFEGHSREVVSVVFSPDGTRIVSADVDWVVRCWGLDGKPEKAPFEEEGAGVLSLGFSRDGKHILGGTSIGIRRWLVGAGTPMGFRPLSGEVYRLGVLANDLVWAWTSDRIHILDSKLEPRGQIFLTRDGWVALSSEGVLAPTDDLHAQIRAIGEDGTVITRRGAVSTIDLRRMRQLFFDEFTFWERLKEGAVDSLAWMKRLFEWLGWLNLAVVPLLLWLISTSFVFLAWLVAPHRLAHWAMPAIAGPELPGWQWLAELVTLVGFFGTTRRALRAWARKHHAQLSAQNLTDRAPVRERQRYCEIGHGPRIDTFVHQISKRKLTLVWIEGAGGEGKSSLAYEMLRRAAAGDPEQPLPILVDEDWKENLLDHLAKLLRPEGQNRHPTPKMVETLAADGKICLLMDSLSERGLDDAEEQVAALIRGGTFRSVAVTSRRPLSQGAVWEKFDTIEARPLTRDQAPQYIATYTPEDLRPQVESRLAPLVAASETLNPLYLRFAIERAIAGELEKTSWGELVDAYLDGLRADRIDLSHDDMLRACRIAATEALRGAEAPRELDSEYLRGVLARAADELPFMNAASTASVDPAAVVEMLISCGVLNRNRTNRRALQFAYDPVAEVLAERKLTHPSPKTPRRAPKKK